MTVDVVALLRELDFVIAEGTTNRSWLLRSPAGESYLVEPTTSLRPHNIACGPQRFVPQKFSGPTPVRRPHHHSLHAPAGQEGAFRHPHRTPAPAGTPRIRLRGRGASPSPVRRRPSGRAAWVRWAVGRCLLLSTGPQRQPVIAELPGTSQQSVSNAARQLGDLVADGGRGLAAADKEALLGHWAEEYPGPGGQEFGWYSLDPVVEQTLKAAKVAELFDASPLVSGDVAADRLAPWKLPSRGRIYVNRPIDLGDDGFVPAPVEEATLITCIPRDPTLWRLVHAMPSPGPGTSALADAAIVYRDVLASGDMDSVEAAGQLKELIIRSKQ